MSYEFYSRSLKDRIAAIEAIHQDQPILNVRALLDDISDGCGGCERMMVSTSEGNDGWISVLGEESWNRTWYVFIEARDIRQLDVEAFATTTHPPQQIVRATYGSMAYGPGCEDAFEQYLRFYRMVEESEEEG